ncbi:MAG TPA: Na+/H+ antiporter [Candidatus Limnocylindrales bacterium]|nr:Na+/H+ antiporter [Candidatus Limnocylindrales bacterium]
MLTESEAGVLVGGSDALLAIEIVFLLLIVATALAIVARRIGIPYPILLVIGGLLLGLVPGLPKVELEPDVVFLLFLPPILFAAGYFTSIRDFRANARKIGLLAVALVLVSAAAVAVVVEALVPGVGWAAAFALGAIVAPPDAVAATAIFRRLGVPRKIVTILEGESLINDATALVTYRTALGVAAGGSLTVAGLTGNFVILAVGGVAVGLVVGAVVAWLVMRVNDPVFSIVITFLAPIAAYLPAEELGFSGVLAAVAGGIWLGAHAPRTLSSEVRVAGVAAWQVLLFLINGAVFILIGLQLPGVIAALSGRSAGELLGLAAAVCLTVIVVRIVWVFVSIYVPYWLGSIRAAEAPPSGRGVFLVSWAGMRGVVSLAAALALPRTLPDGSPFPERDLLIFLAFSVILVTLVGQGLTLPLVVRGLGITTDGRDEDEEAQARNVASEAAVARLDELATEWPGHLPLIDTLRAQYSHRATHNEPDRPQSEAEQELIEHRQIRRAVIEAEREAALRMREDGAISDEAFRRVERDLDLEELRMEA